MGLWRRTHFIPPSAPSGSTPFACSVVVHFDIIVSPALASIKMRMPRVAVCRSTMPPKGSPKPKAPKAKAAPKPKAKAGKKKETAKKAAAKKPAAKAEASPAKGAAAE